MTPKQIQEGLAYSENAFKGVDSHLAKDKALFKQKYDLSNLKVLDFGCGMGGMTLWYAQEWNCDITGIDVDPNHISIAKLLHEKYPNKNVNFELRNILKQPLKEKYDFIILNDVAEHIPINTLQEVFKHLKNAISPKGRIFVSYPPWEGPYASHLNHDLALPWCQFLPNSLLTHLIKRKDRNLVGSKTLLEEYKELNHLNHSRLKSILSNAELSINERISHSKLTFKKWPRLSNSLGRLFSFLVTKELLIIKAIS